MSDRASPHPGPGSPPTLAVASIVGAGVVIEAEHLCMTLRGVQAHGARTVTSSLRGLIRDDARTRAEFLAFTGTSQ